jgi:hypothetical protein
MEKAMPQRRTALARERERERDGGRNGERRWERKGQK